MQAQPKDTRPKPNSQTWLSYWDALHLYRWNPEDTKSPPFVIDTPPPTVSSGLHLGHLFSFTHQDIIARYKRMCGFNVYYPIGWDDNGIPTEQEVQSRYRVKCTINQNDFFSSPKLKPDYIPVSRRKFTDLCLETTRQEEQAYENLLKEFGLSVDWTTKYSTIDERCRQISQASFIKLLQAGQIYLAKEPVLWDVDLQTAVGPAEIIERRETGAVYDIRFDIDGGESIVITTTRPELLPACIALASHPEDSRYQHLIGRQAIVPVFGTVVPIMTSPHADPDKGTGVLMVTTFADNRDVMFWKSHNLPLRQVIGHDGRFIPIDFDKPPFQSRFPGRAKEAYSKLKGLYPDQARQVTVDLLSRSINEHGETALLSRPRNIEYPVKYFESGKRPLELVPTRQWFIKLLEHKAKLLEIGKNINWHPPHMKKRYEDWVNRLDQDWCISRQRYFGVPLPVWYPLDSSGEPVLDTPLTAPLNRLPLDPLTSTPPGYEPNQRDKPNGFTGEKYVLDTWATSALTPQIISFWSLDPKRHQRLFPSDIRPQPYEIIKSWTFYSIVKSYLHHSTSPWKHVLVSGCVISPDGKKIGYTNRGIKPESLLKKFSADAIRYWAAQVPLGTDIRLDEQSLARGERLCSKLYRCKRYILSRFQEAGLNLQSELPLPIHPLDLSWLNKIKAIVQQISTNLDQFKFEKPIRIIEKSIQTFCSDYIELSKSRAYGDKSIPLRDSALFSLRTSLHIFLRLLAPYLPFTTESIWSKTFSCSESPSLSVHTASWPTLQELQPIPTPPYPHIYGTAKSVLKRIRAAKSRAGKSLNWPVQQLTISLPEHLSDTIRSTLDDIASAGKIPPGHIILSPAPDLSVELVLAEAPAPTK